MPSGRVGMGAVPYDGGTTFRVWAPDAEAIAVTGDFSGWTAQGVPLGAEQEGLWSADVPGSLQPPPDDAGPHETPPGQSPPSIS
jgi:1,4-alpha-glucan branching enzyme